MVVDEAQRLPEIFPALRHVIDRSGQKGRFLLLGSASPSLMRSVSETLAGRVALLELTPFLSSELAVSGHAGDRWFWGGFPPIHSLRDFQARSEWFSAYVSTFLERDLPNLRLGLPARRLRTLWMMLTHVHGNLLNTSDLARSLTVSSHTIGGDLDVLEGAFMIRRLRPYHANPYQEPQALLAGHRPLALSGRSAPAHGAGNLAETWGFLRGPGDRRTRRASRAPAGSPRAFLLADARWGGGRSAHP